MSGSIDWQVLSLQLVTTFAHFLWQGAVIGVMLAMVLRLCARRSPHTRYVTACVAFALLPVCVGGTFALVNNNGDAIFVTHSDAQNSIQASPQLNRNAEPPHLSQLVPLVTADEQSSAEPLNVTSQSVDAELAERFERRWSGLLSILSPYLFGVYLVGVAAMLLRFGISIFSSGRLRRACRLIEDATIVQIIAEQAARLGLKRIPLVGLCHRVAVPIVVGILKPMILLPPAILCGFDPLQLAAILSHEMAHIRRYDMLVNLMQRIVEAVLFFHPVTWWISRSISIERENCCDDMAVSGCGRLEFASALLAMAELCARSRGLNIAPQLEALAADGGNASQLSTRIHRLLGEVETPRLIPSRTALATLCMAVIVCGSLSFSLFAQSQETVVQEAEATMQDDVRDAGIIQGEAKTSDSAKDENAEVAPTTTLSNYAGAMGGMQSKNTKRNEGTGKQHLNAPDEATARKAIAAHQKATAIDALPRFYIVADVATQTDLRLKDPVEDSLANLKAAVSQPVDESRWFHYRSTFAWDEKHWVHAFQLPKELGTATGPEALAIQGQITWATKERAAERMKSVGSPAQHVVRSGIAAMWKDHDITEPHYMTMTRHEFWWGANDSHRHSLGTPVPPSESDYSFVAAEEIDGDLCDVVYSLTRLQQLWISQKSGLIRACATFHTNQMIPDFYKSDAVAIITGRKFASLQEYSDWLKAEEDRLSPEKRWQLSKAWTSTLDQAKLRLASFVRFRDFREIAPSIWWPFEEDRANGRSDDKGFSFSRVKSRVTQVRTDIDLKETIATLQPVAGERVQDQRFRDIAIVDYVYRDGLTDDEILAQVQKQYQKNMEDQALIKQRLRPFDAMIGKPAPKLPKDGWIGGVRPDVNGKPFLIHYWATWCGPCKNDLPILKKLAVAGDLIVGLHPGGTKAEVVQQFIDKEQLGYPTYLPVAGEGSSGDSIGEFPVGLFPYAILVGADGKIVAHASLRDQKANIIGRLHELTQKAK